MFFHRRRSDPSSETGRKGTATGIVKPERPEREDYQPKAISRHVLQRSLGHGATIFPMVGSALALFWTVIVNPSPASVAATIGFAFVSAAGFLYNYVVRGEEIARNRIDELNQLRRACDLNELQELRVASEQEGFRDAAREAGELITAYNNLVQYLLGKKAGSSIERFMALADDGYREATQVLQKALDLYRAVGSIDRAALESDLKTWRKQRKKMEDGSPQANSLDAQIEGHEGRLSLCAEREEEMAALIARSNEIETALEKTYLELVDLGITDPTKFLGEDGGAAKRLRTAVESAKRVEERMLGRDTEKKEKRNKYIESARQREEQLRSGSDNAAGLTESASEQEPSAE